MTYEFDLLAQIADYAREKDPRAEKIALWLNDLAIKEAEPKMTQEKLDTWEEYQKRMGSYLWSPRMKMAELHNKNEYISGYVHHALEHRQGWDHKVLGPHTQTLIRVVVTAVIEDDGIGLTRWPAKEYIAPNFSSIETDLKERGFVYNAATKNWVFPHA